MNEISLKEAASEIIPIEEEMSISNPSTVRLFDDLNDVPTAAWFEARNRTHPSNLYQLSDVVYDASIRVLMKDGRRLPESRNMTPPEAYDNLRLDPARIVKLDGSKRYVIATNMASTNYYHWMVQILPGIDWAARTNRGERLRLAANPMLNWQRESLQILGLQDIPILELDVGKQYAFRRAQFNDFVRGELTYAVSNAVVLALRRLAARVPNDGTKRPEAIYVARTDSQYRPLGNEAQLIAIMERLGVHTIVPGAHSVAEQVQHFRAARLVVAPHGAGLSNIAFCEPGTLIYELLPRHYPNACFDFLAQSSRLTYWCEMFGDGTAPADGVWHVDLERVARTVGSSISHIF